MKEELGPHIPRRRGLPKMYVGRKFLYTASSFYGFMERLDEACNVFLLSCGLNPKQTWDNHKFNFGDK